MSWDIAMHMPLHSPVAMSLLKYGASPGKAAIRSVLVSVIRSIVEDWLGLAGAFCCARTSLASSTEAPAAANARDRRDNIKASPHVAPIEHCSCQFGGADSEP